jgi:transcriptional regulator with XRE-family HTH domain
MGRMHPLARLRGRRGWTGRDLARAADVADETVSRIENGRYQPGPKTIYKLARALEMDFDELATLLTEEPDEVSA